jgi:hypothetical protein
MQTHHVENDLYAAAYLLAVGIRLTDIRPVGNRVVFVFDNPDEQASRTVRAYTGGATIPAREFAAAIQQAKTLLYETKFQNSKGTQTERNDNSRHSSR